MRSHGDSVIRLLLDFLSSAGETFVIGTNSVLASEFNNDVFRDIAFARVYGYCNVFAHS